MAFNDLTESQIKSVSTQLWGNIIAASNAKDYALFAKDFSKEMSTVATKAMIEKQWQQQPLLSKLQPAPEFLGYLNNSRGIRVLWRQKCLENEDELLGHLELVYENNNIKVDGAQII